MKKRNFTSLTFSRSPVHWDSWSGGTPRGTLPGASPGAAPPGTPPGAPPGTPPGTPPGAPPGTAPGILLEQAWLFRGRVGGLELKPLPCLELERLREKNMMILIVMAIVNDEENVKAFL